MFAIVFNGVTPNGLRFNNVVGPYDDKKLAQRHVARIRYRIKRGYLSNRNNIMLSVVALTTPDQMTKDILT